MKKFKLFLKIVKICTPIAFFIVAASEGAQYWIAGAFAILTIGAFVMEGAFKNDLT